MNKYQDALEKIKEFIFLGEPYREFDLMESIKIIQELIDKYYKKKPKFISCKCGCNRREHWQSRDSVALKCKKCGTKVTGANELDARVRWNEVMSNG